MLVRHYRSFPKYIFLAGLFILPFVYWPSAPIPFEIPRVWYFQRWSEILILSGVILAPFTLKRKNIDQKLPILILLYFSTVVTSSYFGINFEKSLVGNYYRGDGIITLIHLIGVSLFLALYFERSWTKPLVITIIASSTIIGFWISWFVLRLYVFQDLTTPNWDGAIAVSFGNPNFLAGYLLVTLPFTIYLLDKNNIKKYFNLLKLGIVIQITALLFTKSWASIIGLTAIAIGVLMIKKHRSGLKYIPVFLFILTIIFSSYVFHQLTTRPPNRVVAEGRERIIVKGLLAAKNKPLTGWGWANFDKAFESNDWPIILNDDVYVDKAHSHFLEILVTTGVIGLLIYLAIIMYTSKLLFKKGELFHKYLLLTFILFVIHSQMNVISVSEEIFFWMILGIAASKT